MIIKEEPDISRYIKMREGEMKIGEYKLSYRLTEPVYFALTGENEKLDKWIGEGMPVQGVSPQICRELTRPMYMHLWIPRQKESQGRWCVTGTKIEFSFDEMQYMYLPENGYKRSGYICCILTGNIGMTDYLIGKEGGREGLVYRMEWQNGYSGISYMGIGGNNLFAKYMKICHSYGEGTERYYETEERPEYGFEVEFEDKDHNSRRKYTFHDPFTAAVISGDRKMIEYISEKFPEMIWNRCMGQAVVRADEDLTEYLAETFPEVTEQISFRTIYREKNIYLTRTYLEEHNPECEKNNATICSALDEEREWMEPGVVFETAEITVLSTPGYYKMILEMLPNPDIKRRIRRNIIRWILSNRPVVFDWPGEPKEKRREEMSQHREMLEVFLMADTGELENYMENSADHIICQDIIWNAATLAEEFEKCGIEIKIGYIDLYNANWCTGFYEGKIKDYSRIMKYFQPECLKSRTDGFNEALIEKNNVGLIRTAMKEGFIGSENALELYDYAAVQPQINEQILQALIRISLKSRNEIPGRNGRRKP